ncbi:MAG: RagB/SusD family nutrient uptake outer membrane protein [Prevotella sp.]|nr:RagB/SusD family nutrient uptake outer membrane protein [Candidatus Prevotella equi]
MNKYISKIKKNAALLFALPVMGSAMLASCSQCGDFLDQKGKTNYSAQEVYESVQMTQMRLNALYGALTTDRTYAQDLAVSFCNNTDIECVDGLYANKDGRRDNLSTYRGWGNYYNNSLLAESKNYDMYNELFGIVGNANLTIEGISASELYNNGDAQAKAFLGEALTMRAVAYFDLVRLYGDVPMQFESAKDDLSNVIKGKTNRDVILDQLLADLTKAAELLPWVDEMGYTTERVTKGYALGLKAQIALTRAGWAIREKDMGADYVSEADADATYPTQRPTDAVRKQYIRMAADAANEVIKSQKHKLNPSFKDLWAGIDAAQATYNADKEILFQIPFGLNKSGELGYSVGIRLEYQTADFGYTNSTGHMSLTAKLLYDYEKNDKRRPVTCGMYSIRSTAGQNFNKEGQRIDNFIGNKPFGIPCGKWDPRNMSTEWLSINKVAGGKFGYGINYVKMRYAQVLMMYAEAVNELEALGETYNTGAMSKNEALKLIRQRAGVDDITTTDCDKFFTAIVNENALEFAGEGVRKYDLIRWNLLAEKIMETRNATVSKKQMNSKGEEMNWDAKIAFKLVDGMVDESTLSIGYYQQQIKGGTAKEKVSDPKIGEWKTAFGTEAEDQLNDANYYCGGLIGCPDYQPEVKNRYILPLSNQTISAAGGMMENSYGYK